MNEQFFARLDYELYTRMIRRLHLDVHEIAVCGPGGDLVWSNLGGDGFENSLLLQHHRERIAATNSLALSFQLLDLGRAKMLAMRPLGEFKTKPFGGLLVLVGIQAGTAIDRAGLEETLADIARLVEQEFLSYTEIESLNEELGRRYEELNFLYGTEKHFDNLKDVHDGLDEIVKNCTRHLNVELAMILFPEKDLWSYYSAPGVNTWLAEDGFLKKLAAEIFFHVKLSGMALMVNEPEKFGPTDTEMTKPFKFVAVPVMDVYRKPSGVIILCNSLLKTDFLDSDRKFYEVIAARITKMLVTGRDVLTGLIDRVGFEANIEIALARTRQETHNFTVAKINIDQLDVVNNAFSVVGGDAVLRQIAQLLKSLVRDDDVIARVGGDEFGVLLEDADIKLALLVIERIREKIAASHFEFDKKLLSVTVSIGLFGLDSGDYSLTDVETAVDVACKTAKEKGGNRTQIYHLADSELVKRRGEVQVASHIDRALHQELFELHCQPIVPLWGGNYHYEILLRLKGESGEIFYPDIFMGAAERYNRMQSIDRWVLHNTISMLSRYSAMLQEQYITWGINLSGQSMTDESFLDFVLETISGMELPKSWLYFEITESVAIRNIEPVQDFASKIREMGCAIALDDFGTGYSSYSYLKHLPVNFLKIDGSFIKNLDHDPFNQLAVQSINQLAHYLGVKTIAEYVENEEIVQVLQKIGVDYAQGYVYSKPQPLRQVLDSMTG